MDDTTAVKEVCRLVRGKELNNTPFAASWQTGDVRSAISLLVDMEHVSGVARPAQRYAPSRVGKVTSGAVWEAREEVISDPLRVEGHEAYELEGHKAP
jgi:hypothetical protein